MLHCSFALHGVRGRIARLAAIVAFLAGLCTLPIAIATLHAQAQTESSRATHALISQLQSARTSPDELELGGEFLGIPPHATRYLTRESLLSLPQTHFTTTNDANFRGPTQVSGVAIEELIRELAANPTEDMAIAICVDKYRGNYPHSYVAAHHPVLALEINGKAPSGWPKFIENSNISMGPFLISSANFMPSFKILSHADEPQIPWGVVRLEFRAEAAVYGAIKPRGPDANTQGVQDGYRIAQQNCFRCHNMGDEGGQKAGRPWAVLATWANASPDFFAAYIREPKSKNPKAEMPGFPQYDAATLHALTAYFQTFANEAKQ